MATPHLTSRGRYGGLVNQRNLHAYSGHLAVIRKRSSWSAREFVVPPSLERYTSAASYVTYSSASEKSHTGDNAACRKVRDLFAAKAVGAWNDGHKSCFCYWSRGDTTLPVPNTTGAIDGWSFDPYWAKVTTKTGSAAEAEGELVDGCGASWTAAYFNLYALPLNETQGLSVKLRLYNPSLLAYDWWESGNLRHREINVPPTSAVGSGSLSMRYNFTAELGKPSAFDTSTDVAQDINFSDGAVVNQGKMSDYNMDGDNFCRYNPWNTTKLSPWSTYPTVHYRPTQSYAEYHADVALPAAMVKKLKEMQYDGHGGFWLTIGPSAKDFFTSSLKHGYSAMMYFSRVELVISMTYMYSFN